MAKAPRRRPVVAVDLDEVLGEFVPQIALFHNERYGTELTAADFNSYEFHEVWGGTREEADVKVLAFFESEHFKGDDGIKGIPVHAGAREVLHKHRRKLEFHIVTSRQLLLEETTRQWVQTHYPGIFRDLHFGNQYGDGAKRSKPDMCKDIGAVLLIDDSLGYAKQCADAGIQVLLHGDYAWNRSEDDLPEKITRTAHWTDIDKALGALHQYSGVISVSATKPHLFYVKKAREALRDHPSVHLRALGKAIVVAIDTALELERAGVATRTKFSSSMSPMQTGYKTCTQVELTRTAKYAESLQAAAAAPEGE